jgi:DNA-binding response OmpR family regulator
MSDAPLSLIKLYSADPLIARVMQEQAQFRTLPVELCSVPEEADLVLKAPVRLGSVLQKIRRLQQKLSADEKITTIGSYLFDPAQALLITGDGQEVILTEKESGILKCLLAARGAFVSRRDLLNEVWGYADGVETHTLETHIYRLRQKLESDPARPELLMTAEQGYSLKA